MSPWNLAKLDSKARLQAHLMIQARSPACAQALATFFAIITADMVLVLGDNAGEAVFDILLIEHFPGSGKVYYAVKSSPAINDVTRKMPRRPALPKRWKSYPTALTFPARCLENALRSSCGFFTLRTL
jgi:hypothetical protein